MIVLSSSNYFQLLFFAFLAMSRKAINTSIWFIKLTNTLLIYKNSDLFTLLSAIMLLTGQDYKSKPRCLRYFFLFTCKTILYLFAIKLNLITIQCFLFSTMLGTILGHISSYLYAYIYLFINFNPLGASWFHSQLLCRFISVSSDLSSCERLKARVYYLVD